MIFSVYKLTVCSEATEDKSGFSPGCVLASDHIWKLRLTTHIPVEQELGGKINSGFDVVCRFVTDGRRSDDCH